VVLHESDLDGHGWAGAEEGYICNFLERFSLPPPPRRISINADQEGRWYWADVRMRDAFDSFARFEVEADPDGARLDLATLRNVQSIALDLPAVGLAPIAGILTVRWDIEDGSTADLLLEGIGVRPSRVVLDGVAFPVWEYDEQAKRLALHGTAGGVYQVFFDVAIVPDTAETSEGGSRAWVAPNGSIHYSLNSAGLLGWSLYDVAGRLRLAQSSRWIAAGKGLIPIDSSVPHGMYFLVLERPGLTPVRLKVPVSR